MKNIILALMLMLGVSAFAQQDQHYSQYMFNGLVINPAYAGSNDRISTAFFHRMQWVGFEDYPVTQSFSIHTPMAHQSMGLGLHIQNDKIGPIQNTSITASSAYRINFNEGVLSFGMQAGVMNYTFDDSKIDALHPEDVKLVGFSTMVPDIGFGTYYVKKNYYVGFSIPHLIQSKINERLTSQDFAQLTRHYYFTAAYQYQINRDFAVVPSMLLKTLRFAPRFAGNNQHFQTSSLDITTHLKYQDKFWIGGTYRAGDSFNAQLGMDISSFVDAMEHPLKIGYAYDMTTSNLSAFNNGSHEIMMIFDFELQPKANAVNKDIHYTSPRLF